GGPRGPPGRARAARTLHHVHRERRPDVPGDQRLLDVVPGRAFALRAEGAAETRHEDATRALEPVLEALFDIDTRDLGVFVIEAGEQGAIEPGRGRGLARGLRLARGPRVL